MSTIPTPPSSTLSQPSDTELDTNNMPSSRPLYLVVATAVKPPMGIGLKGQLPWPSLKNDMAFFRHVTSNVPKSESTGGRNAVIMGRKTWESIPKKFRPLKGRVNVVVTRDVEAFGEADGREVLAVSGLGEGLKVLGEKVGRTFVIGGSQIYEAAMQLRHGGLVRILQTQIRKSDGEEIECDTFFPLQLGESAQEEGWREVSTKEVEDWVDGEIVPGRDGQWEADGESGMEIRLVGWEKLV